MNKCIFNNYVLLYKCKQTLIIIFLFVSKFSSNSDILNDFSILFEYFVNVSNSGDSNIQNNNNIIRYKKNY